MMTSAASHIDLPLRPRLRSLLLAAARGAGAILVVIGATAAGIGWLYLLRGAGALDFGPRIAEALPLQRLAGNATQPLARVLAAWLPTGVLAGLALRAIGFTRRPARAALLFVLCLVLLAALGAAADAVTANDPIRMHTSEQVHRLATWLAAAVAAAGAALPRGRP